MEKNQPNLNRFALFATAGISALLAVNIILDRIRKYKKQQQKNEIKKLKQQYEQKLSQAAKEARLGNPSQQELRRGSSSIKFLEVNHHRRLLLFTEGSQ